MTQFLNWVFAQAAKVYDWFGNTYYTLKNAAANAWNWAVSKALDAYNNAIDWAFSQVQASKAYVIGLINHAQQILTDITNGIKDDLTGLFDWVEWKFATLGDFTSDLIAQALAGVTSFVESVKNDITQSVISALNWVSTNLQNAFSWINTLKTSLLNIVNVLTPARLQALTSFLTSGLATITTFFTNPLVFILDLIESKFITYACYILAWALGTTRYDLPTQKPWRK